MATNIRGFNLNGVYYENGNGIPSHISGKGTVFTDLDSGTLYLNKNSVSQWGVILDSISYTGDTSITALSYDNANTLSIFDSTGGTFSTTINIMSGLTVNGSLTANTISATTILTPIIIGTTGATGLIVQTNNTASSSLAKGTSFTPTLGSTDNNDVLVALDISPTFNTGAFTNVLKYGLRVAGVANVGNSVSAGARTDIGQNIMTTVNNSAIGINSASGTSLHIENIDTTTNSYTNICMRVDNTGNGAWTNISYLKTAASTGVFRIHNQNVQQFALYSTGNLILQNGGTFTDNGYRLEVVGTAKITSKLSYTATITASGTTGNQTINNPSGTVNIEALGTTVTVTNSLCTTSSIVTAVIRTDDVNAIAIKSVVPSNGSFIITLTTACAAEVSIGFIVNN